MRPSLYPLTLTSVSGYKAATGDRPKDKTKVGRMQYWSIARIADQVLALGPESLAVHSTHVLEMSHSKSEMMRSKLTQITWKRIHMNTSLHGFNAECSSLLILRLKTPIL